MTNVRLSDLAYTTDVPAIPLGPPPGADTRLRARATLYAWDATSWHAVLTNPDDGTAGSIVPAIGDQGWAGLVGKPIWVLRDPIDGRHLLALGPVMPAGVTTDPTPTPTAFAADDLFPPEPVTRTVTVLPTWSGTYRTGHGWDAWATDGDGGRSTLYQGDAAGSGALAGLVTYGDRITALQAEQIVSATLLVRPVLPATRRPTPRQRTILTLQGAAHDARPPGPPRPVGSQVLIHPPLGEVHHALLPTELLEPMRTGQIRSLCLVGETYAALRGTSAADGMSLRITYTRTE